MKTKQVFLVTLLCIFMYACGGGDTSSSDTTSESENTANPESSDEDKQTSSSSEESLRRYEVKSGIIEYKVSGLQTGTETIYFDNWGMKEAKYSKTEMNMGGVSQKNNQVNYIDGEWNYTYDATQKKGMKLKNPLFETIVNNMEEKDLTALGEKMMKEMGGEKTGQEEILGRTCDVWEIKNLKTKTWVWKNIPLKTESTMMQTLTIEAISFEENASIPADKLALPEDVEFQDMSNMVKDVPGLGDGN